MITAKEALNINNASVLKEIECSLNEVINNSANKGLFNLYVSYHITSGAYEGLNSISEVMEFFNNREHFISLLEHHGFTVYQMDYMEVKAVEISWGK